MVVRAQARDLAAVDPDLARILEQEAERQQYTLAMIASENYASLAVRQARASVLTNKYSEGYPGKRYYQGNGLVDEVEALAIAPCQKSLWRRARQRAAARRLARRTWRPTWR